MLKLIMFLGGFILVIVGMSLSLLHWDAVVIVFKGVSGPLLAVAGLVILFASTLKNNA